MITREYFWSRVDWDENDPDRCWEWQRTKDRKGYGHFGRGLVHRYAYEDLVGPIPDGAIVMHTCDNPPCCNPAHLRVGTVADNQRDMKEKGRSRIKERAIKTHCVNGHLWAENTYMYPDGKRICRICKNAVQRRYRDTPEGRVKARIFDLKYYREKRA